MTIRPQFSPLLSLIILALRIAIATSSSAQTFTTLATFDGNNGDRPFGPLVQGTDGNFYGTTVYGGANCNGGQPYGCGTIFKMNSTGTLATLYSFCSQPNCTDGSYPFSGIIQAANGSFYGTTGGDNDNGTVFRITSKGKLITLYRFCSRPNCTDGEGPVGGLVQAANGNFYGTTALGGTGTNGNGGTVFKITPKGKLTTLYSFCSQPNCADGQEPLAALIQATDGNFYGTTQYGGTGAGQSGTIFKITPAGKFTSLYSFCSQPDCADGIFPSASLVQGSDGNFYGTTQENGTNGGPGTAFKVTSEGALTTLYTFCSQPNCDDGGDPFGGLVLGTDGNFYGATYSGGTGKGRGGEIFRMSPEGTLTGLYGFCSQPDCTDGELPYSSPILATNGIFYGVTASGGIFSCNPDDIGCGTSFSLSVGLGSFIETRPTSGKIGKRVVILGNDLTGATSVEFNGTSAIFKVASGTEITTNIPKSATTGYVSVTTPNGILSSNVPFVVP